MDCWALPFDLQEWTKTWWKGARSRRGAGGAIASAHGESEWLTPKRTTSVRSRLHDSTPRDDQLSFPTPHHCAVQRHSGPRVRRVVFLPTSADPNTPVDAPPSGVVALLPYVGRAWVVASRTTILYHPILAALKRHPGVSPGKQGFHRTVLISVVIELDAMERGNSLWSSQKQR
jgi:hypothetical protein